MVREKLPYELCNRYSECSVNNCPLDSVYPDRYTDLLDVEKRCGYAKSYRVQISEKFPGILKYGGMTVREYSYKQRWANLSPEEKERRVSFLTPFTKRSDTDQD
ncbi:MAG: hypothetical protein AB7D09_13490 [Methanosarcina sp.]